MPRLKLLVALLFIPALAFAQRAMTSAELVAFVKSQIQRKGDDRQTADYLSRSVKLTQKLDDRTVEDLQGQGAGPKTVAALKKLVELSASLAEGPPVAAPPPPPPAPKPPSEAEQAQVLEEMRKYALNYTKNLPNFTCAQVTKRHLDPVLRGYMPQGDEIRELVSWVDGKEDYKVQMVAGKSVVNVSHMQLGGVTSSGEWGQMLENIFDPMNQAEFHYERWGTLRDKRTYVYAYSIPESHGYSMNALDVHREYTSAYKGLIFADHDTKQIVRVTLETVGIPADFPVREVLITLDYDYTKIGDREYLLPYHFELDSKEDRFLSKNSADYRLYRKFGTEATITFGDIDAAPATPEDRLKEK
jgi:hypothetical protein